MLWVPVIFLWAMKVPTFLPGHLRQVRKKSTIITTNLLFANWGKIFYSTTMATAITDRLFKNSEVIILEGPSYRTKPKAKGKMIEK